MIALLACSALLAVGPDGPPVFDAQQTYREARAKAGRSPDDQVKLALWCEAHGLTAERLHHLTLAVLADPSNAAARGLMGLVSHQGRWRRPEVVAEKLKADPDRSAILADYEQKRQKAAYTADAQWALGLWAGEHGLPEQAKAHLTAVIRLDPSREQAWMKLGCKKHDGRWVTDAQIAAEKAEVESQKSADRKWKPLLEKSKAMLGKPSKREEADAALAEVTDPRAVPMILHTFATNRPDDQLRAVQLLGQVDAPSASRALAGLAVLSKSAEVRRVALEILKGRDPRDFVQLWIALVRKPIRFEVRPVAGPGSPGSLFIEGEKANLRRVYAPPAMPSIPYLPGATVGYDADGLPVLNYDVNLGSTFGPAMSEAQFRTASANQRQAEQSRVAVLANANPNARRLVGAIERSSANPFDNVARVGVQNPNGTVRYNPVYERELEVQIPIGEMIRETQVSATVAQQQLASDVASLERLNDGIRQSNDRVIMALKAITGGDLGDDAAAWNRWWTDRQGYAITASPTEPTPTIVENVPIGYLPTATPTLAIGETLVGFDRTQHHSCFAGGTAVRTIDGDRAIETVRAGDLVLVQDTKSGALGYQAVVAAYHNPPNSTLRIKLGEAEAVVATGIHRFWKVGKGWTMARDLKAGDLVRVLDGAATVSAVEPDRVQRVFNLEVAEGHSFLVGKLGALVHDNSLVEATPSPFDSGAITSK